LKQLKQMCGQEEKSQRYKRIDFSPAFLWGRLARKSLPPGVQNVP